MSSPTYVEAPNANLVCCICRSPFVEPCTTRTCCHTFCYECVARSVAISQQCPIDRTPLSMQDLAPADPVVRNLVDELIVECPQRSLGCSYTCQRCLMSAHLKGDCVFVEVACPEGKQGCTILRKDLHSHEHPHDVLPDESEPKARSTAPQKDATPAPPTGSRPAESAGGLATENELLRMRLAALEGIVTAMRLEMQVMQRALGPWYNPHSAFGAATSYGRFSWVSEPSPEAAPHPDSLYRTPAVAQSADRSAAEAPHLDGARSGERDVEADIASYFPPADALDQDAYAISPLPAPWRTSSQLPARPQEHRDDFPTPPPAARRTQPSSQAQAGPSTAPAPYATPHPAASLSPNTWPPPTYPAAPSLFSPAELAVPPLDPRTPLPDTLAALHASLGTLAGAVGALAAARAAETVHTGEELRGVRASMHGLRLQLHDVLTALYARDGAPGSGGEEGHGGGGAPFASGMGALPPWFPHGPRAFGPPIPMHPAVTKL